MMQPVARMKSKTVSVKAVPTNGMENLPARYWSQK